jgi:predicted dehydrogenase
MKTNSDKMLGVAIIGAGNIGRVRARVIQQSSGCKLRIVADVDKSRAIELAHSVNAQPANNWQEAITSPQVDAVVVCTPTKFHVEAVKAALNAGKHVLCEKPLARNYREAQGLGELAANHGLIFKTGFNYRYMAHVRKAKEILDSGALGDLYFLRCRYGHGGRPGYEKAWCTDLDLSGGGVLLEQGIHILDLTRYLLGEPAQVLACCSRFFWSFPEVEDNCFLFLRTDSEQTAEIHVSWTQWRNIFSLEIFGREGYLHLTGRDGHYGSQQLVRGRRQANHSRPEEEIFHFPAADNSWNLEWQEFAAAIRSKAQPMGNFVDSMHTLALVDAAYESSRKQCWMDVPRIETQIGRAA